MALASRGAAAAVACVLLALAASAAGAGSHSHSPAPAPTVDCASKAAALVDCLDYVSPGSGTRRPSASCCGAVKTAVADPVTVGCLCSLAGSKDLGLPIDIKRVLELPGACGASNAAFSKCNISALSPTGAPASAPSTGGSSSSGGAAASPPKAAAAGSPMTATALVAAVAAPLLAYFYLL